MKNEEIRRKSEEGSPERERKNVRALALDLLMESQKEDRQSHLLLREALAANAWLQPRDRAFFVRLFEGTIEYRIQLDYLLDQYSRIRTKKMRPVIREILRMGVYQILYMDSVPDSAAVNEAVRLAGRRGFGSLRGFVNGVLRSVARNKNSLPWPEKKSGEESFWIQVHCSMPAFLVDKWMALYGPEVTEIICKSFLRERPLTVRLRGQADAEEFLGQLPEGCRAEPCPEAADVWYLWNVGNLTALPDFQNGNLYVQDICSILAVRAAGIRPGDRVLDLCAAPGGKSILAADLMREGGENGLQEACSSGTVDARDLTDRKAALLQENKERCRVGEVRPFRWDATICRPEDAEQYDVVIADVPCSGYGVIGRKPDIRYHVSPEKEASLQKLQREILTNAVRAVRQGGTLLFSTCTVNPKENEENTAWLLEHFPLEKQEERQFLPGIDCGDGFYYAVLTRRKEA